MIDQLFDYHIHPDFSLDASGAIDQYCQKAIELGLAEIAFTTHYDTNPHRAKIDPFVRIEGKIVPLSLQTLNYYFDEVKKAQEQYYPQGLSILLGLEVDYHPEFEERLRKELMSFNLDYCLGAIHCLDHIAISAHDEAESYFKNKAVEQMAEEYFQMAKKAAESELFDCLAHLDIYRKYGLGFYGEKIWTCHSGRIEPALEALAKSNTGLEINTSLLRKGQKEFSPCLEILNLARKAGVEVKAIGSDAHKIEDLGANLIDAAMFAWELFPSIDEG